MFIFLLCLLILCCKWNQDKITESDFTSYHLVVFAFYTEKETAKLGISFIFQQGWTKYAI